MCVCIYIYIYFFFFTNTQVSNSNGQLYLEPYFLLFYFTLCPPSLLICSEIAYTETPASCLVSWAISHVNIRPSSVFFIQHHDGSEKSWKQSSGFSQFELQACVARQDQTVKWNPPCIDAFVSTCPALVQLSMSACSPESAPQPTPCSDLSMEINTFKLHYFDNSWLNWWICVPGVDLLNALTGRWYACSIWLAMS